MKTKQRFAYFSFPIIQHRFGAEFLVYPCYSQDSHKLEQSNKSNSNNVSGWTAQSVKAASRAVQTQLPLEVILQFQQFCVDF